jgi:hypothetical protein
MDTRRNTADSARGTDTAKDPTGQEMLTPFRRLARSASNNKLFRALSVLARDSRQQTARSRLRNINAFERRVYSQNGEDGIIAELFARIAHRRYFVEIGVEDGRQCNAALLVRHCGWQGVMIEADDRMYDQLRQTYESFPVSCVHSMVDRENIAPTLDRLDVPESLDLLSIDIDGNDYYIWEALGGLRASVVVIEYNASFGREISKTIAYNGKHVWRKDRYYGASLPALEKLGARLGYVLLGTERRGVNAFFVRRDLLRASGFPKKSAHEAWRRNVLLGLLPKGAGPFFEP